MIIFEQTLRDLLIRTNLVDNRVFLMRAAQRPAAQTTVPYIVFFLVGPVDPLGVSTTMSRPTSLIEGLYQISIFDTSQSRALAIGDSLRMDLHTLSGDFENVHFGRIFYMTQTWAWEADTLLYQVIQEYRMMYNYLTSDPPPVTPNRSTTATKEQRHHEHASKKPVGTAARSAHDPSGRRGHDVPGNSGLWNPDPGSLELEPDRNVRHD